MSTAASEGFPADVEGASVGPVRYKRHGCPPSRWTGSGSCGVTAQQIVGQAPRGRNQRSHEAGVRLTLLVRGVVGQRLAQQDPRPPRVLLEEVRATLQHLTHQNRPGD